MKPLPPVKPTEKLPVTHHLTIVPSPEKGDRYFAVVATEMQGDQVLRRRVVATEENKSWALDEFCRVATRIFHFGEAQEAMEGRA